tara:strand:+ start:46233 stop:46514 length:282 start_codon:yes stop_codon:yes gene_type:complete
MKHNQVLGYALSLAGLGVAVYVAGRAWKASKSSTIGDKVVEAVEGAVSTGDVTTGETGGADAPDVIAQEASNFTGGGYANMTMSTDSGFNAFH